MPTFKLMFIVSLILQYCAALFGLLLVTVFAYQYLPSVQMFYATGMLFSIVYLHLKVLNEHAMLMYSSLFPWHCSLGQSTGKFFLKELPRRWHSNAGHWNKRIIVVGDVASSVRFVVIYYALYNISNTRDSVSSGYPNTERTVENTMRSGVILTKSAVFEWIADETLS